MSKAIARRLWAFSPLKAPSESIQILQQQPQCLRRFSNTSHRRVVDSTLAALDSLAPKPNNATVVKSRAGGGMGSLSRMLGNNQRDRQQNSRRPTAYSPLVSSDGESLFESQEQRDADPFQLSVYATKHNTHITIMGPDDRKDKDGRRKIDESTGKPPLMVYISMSAGNLGFKHSQRKHYDSAFQLASYVFARMQERGINEKIRKMEVQLRGFGAGREAVTKALLGSEGRFIRGKVIKVSDATRLKFGGTRSNKPRRLG
ncbi:hypothetical protein B0O99DRAFT_629636 [Bisporella sp. PMI_857]|nr:hypothetical protein B0O99DRAFT_629636 [Bisporella sp. PMI_857]